MGGLSKQQISNVFNSQEMLQSPLLAIEKYSGVRNGEIRADFYDDCQNIPDPSALDPMQKNLLLLDDCFLGKQNKAEAYYTRGRHNNCDAIYIAQNYSRLPRHTIRENSNYSFKWSIDEGNTWTLLHIPTGCYELEAINAEITRILGNSDITILPNVNTLQCILSVVGTKCKVSFDVPNSLSSVFGFKQGIV